jgi:predicted kinase
MTGTTVGANINLTHEENAYTSNTPRVMVDNPLPHVLPEGENAAPLEVIGSTASDKLVIIMVGLPATGKTHIAKRICRFLSFFHDIPSQIFNVGDYRRQLCGAQMPADFYNSENVEGMAARKIACDAALADLVEYIQQDGVRVAAFDATNSTFERRQHILHEFQARGIFCKKMFVESVCDQTEVSTSIYIYIYIMMSDPVSNKGNDGGRMEYIFIQPGERKAVVVCSS